jgi:hypothetical protein
MSIETAQLVISLCGLVIAIIGIPLLYFQLRDLRNSSQVAAHSATYEQAAAFRAHLVEYPHLRKYFFDGVPLAADSPDYDRAVSIAEVFLNYLEYIAVLRDNFGKENDEALESFVLAALDGSPLMAHHLATNPRLYSEKLVRFSEARPAARRSHANAKDRLPPDHDA